MRKLLIAFTSVLFAVGTIGTNIGPALVDDHPLLILMLSSRSRNLFGAVPFIDPFPFFLIGFVRLLMAALALFYVGEMPRIYRWTERMAIRGGWVAAFFLPGSNIVCLLLGHLKLEPRKFVAAVTSGIVFRLIVLWYGGKAFESQIRSALDWIDQYQWWVVGGLFALTFLQTARRKSPGAPES